MNERLISTASYFLVNSMYFLATKFQIVTIPVESILQKKTFCMESGSLNNHTKKFMSKIPIPPIAENINNSTIEFFKRRSLNIQTRLNVYVITSPAQKPIVVDAYLSKWRV